MSEIESSEDIDESVIVNNSSKCKHIFQRTIYPGQKILLKDAYSILKNRVDKKADFVDWLKDYIPDGWYVQLGSDFSEGSPLLDSLKVPPTPEQVSIHKEYSEVPAKEPSISRISQLAVNNLSARDLFNLRVKDDPALILSKVNSLTKLRRTLTFCNKNGRKAVLTKIVKRRIKELM